MTPDEFRRIRGDLGLTQIQLARILSYNSGVRISEIEHGHMAIPDRVAMLMDAMQSGWRPHLWPEERK